MNRFETLNNHEIKILELTCEGLSAWKIGKCLNLSENTVSNLRSRLIRYIGVKNSAQLAAEYIKYKHGYKS